MIVTLTANPSLDRTIELAHALDRGEVQRASASHEQPGGKGVNVSRALIASGLPTLAVLPGSHDDPFVLALLAEQIPTVALPIDGRVRSNVTLTEPDGTTTKINEPGPTLTAADESALIALVVTHSVDADWLVLAGSLPPGISADFYARVVHAVRSAAEDRGADAAHTPRIAVDSSGLPMAALIASRVGVDLVKPNADELAELTSHPDPAALEADPDAALAAAQTLLDAGCGAVLATLGAKGAVLATRDGAWFATMPPIVPRSTVGAGDSSLAGYLHADSRDATAPERLAQAVAHGAAAASLAGSTMPSADQTHPESAIIRSLSPITADH